MMRDALPLFLCVGIPVFVFGLIIFIQDQDRKTLRRKIDAARLAYQGSLGKLKASPTDPNVKEQTLALGRAYADLTRNRKGVTVFDEMALMNDINAATAAATAQAAPAQTSTGEQRLVQLADLKARGVISDAEYVAQRTKILSEM